VVGEGVSPFPGFCGGGTAGWLRAEVGCLGSHVRPEPWPWLGSLGSTVTSVTLSGVRGVSPPIHPFPASQHAVRRSPFEEGGPGSRSRRSHRQNDY